MSPEVHGLPEFYASPLGLVAARRLRERLHATWPDLTGQSLLGIGWTAPYLGLWQTQAARCLSLVPPQNDFARWPAHHPALIAEGENLPFPDRSMDRVLLIHGLEGADHARRMLREVWRVLADDGRVLVVVPNRRGLWAHVEKTPFGQGQPYSMGQLKRLLRRHLFAIERQEAALFIPPFGPRSLLRGAQLWERMGQVLAARFAGLVMIEATKAVWSAMPAGETASPARRLVMIGDGGWPRETGGASMRLPQEENADERAEEHRDRGLGRL